MFESKIKVVRETLGVFLAFLILTSVPWVIRALGLLDSMNAEGLKFVLGSYTLVLGALSIGFLVLLIWEAVDLYVYKRSYRKNRKAMTETDIEIAINALAKSLKRKNSGQSEALRLLRSILSAIDAGYLDGLDEVNFSFISKGLDWRVGYSTEPSDKEEHEWTTIVFDYQSNKVWLKLALIKKALKVK